MPFVGNLNSEVFGIQVEEDTPEIKPRYFRSSIEGNGIADLYQRTLKIFAGWYRDFTDYNEEWVVQIFICNSSFRRNLSNFLTTAMQGLENN